MFQIFLSIFCYFFGTQQKGPSISTNCIDRCLQNGTAPMRKADLWKNHALVIQKPINKIFGHIAVYETEANCYAYVSFFWSEFAPALME